MARSPEAAATKKPAANPVTPTEDKPEATPTHLRGPDGYVYVYSELLAREPGFFPFKGEIAESGFAKE